jgi:hypothetical protein
MDDAAVKSGLLQVFVRMKPVSEATETCMHLDQNQLLKATWCAPTAAAGTAKSHQRYTLLLLHSSGIASM